MPDIAVDNELRERAKKRVQDIKGFYIHLGVYVIVNAALFAIDMATSPDTWWFYWPLLGWGIGVAIHAFSLLIEGGVLGPAWEERQVEKLLRREEQHHRNTS